MPYERFELISFKVCPFVQRSVITMRYKGQPFDITYIDLQNKPAWFLEISPFGKVPVLRVDDTVLFESAVINEFIDDITSGSLMPEDPLLRAKNRAWIEFGSHCLFKQHDLYSAEDEARFEELHASVLSDLGRIEGILVDGPFFNGTNFSLVDAAYAPLLQRYEILNRWHPLFQLSDFPRIARWWEALLAMDAVGGSVVPEFEELFRAHVRKSAGYGAQLFAAEG